MEASVLTALINCAGCFVVKICFISDTHLTEPRLPEAQILFHCGDLTFRGNEKEIRAASSYLRRTGFKEVIAIAGNHDFMAERNLPFFRKLMAPTKILMDSGITSHGLKIWGCPWMPRFYDWAFMKSEEELYNNHYSKIPEGLDILLTHGPAKWILDKTKRGDHAGSESLRRRLFEMTNPPKIVASGHIHKSDSTAIEVVRGITFINCSVLDEQYDPAWEPVVIDYERTD